MPVSAKAARLRSVEEGGGLPAAELAARCGAQPGLLDGS